MSARLTAAAVPAPEQGAGRDPRPLVDSYRRLAEVFHHVLSEESFDNLLDRIADTLADLVPYDALHLYEADLAAKELVPVLARTEWQQEVMRTRPGFGQGITGWAAANRVPVLSNQAHLDPRVVMVPGTPVEPEALISVPLVARGSLKGALNIYRTGEDASFDEDEFELAKWFGDAVALAVDNVQVRATLEHQAQTDSLTGLYNHRYFHERLRAELTRATRARDTVGLLMFDIDDFKRVNDVRGHAAGDEILVALANAASSLVRASDIVCRIGGEEFAVIMPSSTTNDALGLARRLREHVRELPCDAAGELTLSIGLAEGPEHATNPRELVACAETAMMTAKASGKDGVVRFGEQSDARPGAPSPGRDARSIAHLKMLHSVVGRLNSFNSVREIGEAIVTELRMLVDYHSCRVYLVEGAELAPIAVRGNVVAEAETLAELRVPVGAGITGHVAATGQSMLIENARDSEIGLIVPGTEPIDESVIAVPLRYGSRVNGVVFLSKLGAGQFDDNDLRLLEVLAGYAAVALENAHLYETLQREAEHAKAWLEFSDAMSAAGSFEAIARETVRIVARLLETGRCSLWLEDRATGDVVCAASEGYAEDEETIPILSCRVTKLAGEAMIQGRNGPFALSAAEAKEMFFGQPPDIVFRAVAIAPLASGYGVCGWITVRTDDDEPTHFTGERLRLLEGLAFRASMALEKALLYRDQRESASVANALLEFGRELALTADAEQALETAVDLVARALDVPRVYALLQDPETRDVVVGASYGLDENAPPLRFPRALIAHTLARGEGAFALSAVEVDAILARFGVTIQGREEPRPIAVAPLSVPGDRLGCLVAAAPGPDHVFSDVALRLLAGMAQQAALLIAR